MIGVAVNSTDLPIAAEFFELFKTPWERAAPGRRYPVIVSTLQGVEELDADLFLLYGAGETVVDREVGIAVRQVPGAADLDWRGSTLPIYGGVATFDADADLCAPRCLGNVATYSHRAGSQLFRRIGYDLFGEIRRLLTEGQPAARALTPTLELHIALLRHFLRQSEISFVEIPPRPHGYEFICCLTHDVDFFGVRRHRFDRTMAGFVVRASVGTLMDLARGRRVLAEAVRNWAALLSLPLVFLGLKRDFWHPFEDYRRAEKGRRSTFFLVPFKGRPGVAPDGATDPARAVRYEVSEIQGEMQKAAPDCEFAVHGIDAWRDVEAGLAEMRQLTSATGRETAGVRMHWLYFDRRSPQRLEAAGFDYDSTCGYNDAVGYRAGTSQVFRLPESENLMELPLSIMDSALFFRRRMNLTHRDASHRCGHIVGAARRFGGTVVINWHDRSLAPERLSGGFYQKLLDDVDAGGGAWFATAGDAVDWFRWRRSIRFAEHRESGTVRVIASAPRSPLPPAVVCVHRAANDPATSAVRLDGHEDVEVAL